jgi:simple sugar transport system substrate-binding protein
VKRSPQSSQLAPGGINRRNLLGTAALSAAGIAGLPAILDACGSAASGAQGNFPSHPKWNFVFVNHVTTNAFFTPTQYGIQDACAALGCSYQWTGSANAVVSEMVNAFNTAVSSKADGIAVCLVDPTAFNAPVQAALQAGIPVVSYNADEPNTRLAYIGQDLLQSGIEMGKRALQSVTSGEIVGFIATPGQSNIQPRIDGLQQAIKDSGLPITFTAITTGAQADGELSAIDAYYQGHKNVKGMYAVDGGSTAGLAQVSQKYNLPSLGIHCGGFDLEPTTLNGIKNGFLDFTIDQQPYLQGFIPTVQLFLYKLSGGLMQPAETDTGLLFVTKDNVGPYLSTQTRFEGSSSAQKVVSHS